MRCFASLLALGVALIPRVAFAYGEPVKDGDPNHEERLLLVLTNQVRAEPYAWPGWDTSLATPEARTPLAFDGGLLQAARFHGDDMAMNGFFAHESSDGTPFGTRVSRYFSGGGAGENIYTAFQGGAREAINGWMNSDGHRRNILDASWDLLGTGFSTRAGQLYYVQDFGAKNGSKLPPIPGGALEPISGGKVRLIANYFDARGRAPMSIVAVLGTESIALEKIAGQDGNSTHAATTAMPGDCATLYFVAVDADKVPTPFPTTGALLAGKNCQTTFTTARPDNAMTPDRPLIGADEGGCTCVTAGWARGDRLRETRVRAESAGESASSTSERGIPWSGALLLFAFSLLMSRRLD